MDAATISALVAVSISLGTFLIAWRNGQHKADTEKVDRLEERLRKEIVLLEADIQDLRKLLEGCEAARKLENEDRLRLLVQLVSAQHKTIWDGKDRRKSNEP